MATRELKVEIVGDASSLSRAFGKASGTGDKFGRSLLKLGKIATIGAGAAFVGLGLAVKNGFNELEEGQKATAQTTARLKSTGEAANVTAQQVLNLAEAQSKLTGIDDEAVQAGENMLLTFTNIRNEMGKNNDIFNQSTVAVENMATAMNDGAIPSAEQLSTVAIRVGKALNDPVKGMTALSRVGVQFTADQKKTIEALVKSGDTMGAQKLILAELTKEFGGSAKAAGDTLPGQLAKARNAFDNISQSLAVKLLPYLTQLLQWVNAHMPQIQTAFDKVAGFITGAFDAIGDAWGKAEPAATAFANWARDNPDKVKNLAIAVGTLATGLYLAAGAQAAFNIAALANPYVALAAAILLLVGALAGLYITNAKVHKAVNDTFDTLRTAAQTILPYITGAWQRFGDSFIAIGKAVFGTVTLGFRNMLDVLRGIINIFVGVFTGDWRRVWTGVKQIFDGMIGNLLKVVQAWVGALLTVAKQAGAAIVQGIVAGAARLGPAIATKLLAIREALKTASQNALSWAIEIGQAIVDGILRGMGNLFSAVKDKIIGGVKGAIDGAMGVFGHSPQEVIGVALVDGIIRGWNQKSAGISNAIVDKVNAAIDAAQAAVVAKQGVFSTAFDSLVSNALAAFDKVTSEFQTKTEKKIARQDEARAKADRAKALADAKAAVTAAQTALATPITQNEGESPEDFFKRQLEAMNANNAALAAAQQQQADAEFAIQRAKDEKKAAQERKAYDDSRELQKRHFDEQLQALETQLEKGRISAAQFRAKVLALFEKFDVPFKNAGKALGGALAEGLHESFDLAAGAARDLVEAIARQVRKLEMVVDVSIRPSGNPQHRQHGGSVRRGSPYVVGEAGPELFIPSSAGRISPAIAGGGGVGGMAEIHTNVYIDSVQVTELVRREMLRFEKRNGRSAV